MDEIRGYAQIIGPSVVYELDQANALATEGFYTEATLRLGRAVEASLYGVASEIGADLTKRSIGQLARLQDMIRNQEVNITRKRDSNEVRALSNVSRRLAQAIAYLAEDESLREGELDEEPRPNEQLLREFTQMVDDESLKRRLESQKSLLRMIQEYRNSAAHPSLSGEKREIMPKEYEDLMESVALLISSLSDLVIGERARKQWAPE